MARTTNYRPDDHEISAGQRVLRTDGAMFNRFFTLIPRNLDKIEYEDGSVDDTLRMMERIVHTYKSDTAEIAQLLRKDKLVDTIKSIWDFLYWNIQYKLDVPGLEQLRRPARSWSERFTGIDCDDFSMFASSILTNLGIQHSLRITRYSQPSWQHVYVVVPKDGNRIDNGYHTLDAVLAEADYEKPFTAKQDYKMSLTGINIAVLSGFGLIEEPAPTTFDVLLGFGEGGAIAGTPDANSARYEDELYKFLVATRTTIDAAPEAYRQSTGGNPSDMVKMLDYAIYYWYTDKREEALGQLDENEKADNILNGLGAFNAVEVTPFNAAELYGDDDAYEVILQGLGQLGKAKNGTKKKPGKFFSTLKKIANPKTMLLKLNPATIAIRNGVLLAIKLNIGKMAQKLRAGYATPEQMQRNNISPQQAAAAKGAIAKIEKMFKTLGGNPDNLKKAVLRAKKGRLNGLGQLGVAPLIAGIAAALPFIKKIMDVIKKSGLIKPGESVRLTPDGAGAEEAADEQASAEQLFETASSAVDAVSDGVEVLAPRRTARQQQAEDDNTYAQLEQQGIQGLGSPFSAVGDFFKGNPGIALALTAGGAYMLYNATKSGSARKAPANGLGGVAQRRKRKKVPTVTLK
jgi:hypothetical protein